MRKWVASWLGICAFISGCGGGGGGGSANVLSTRYSALMADVNSEALAGTMSHYSDEYYDDCSTWNDVQSGWQGIFSEPNYALTLQNLSVSSEVFNNGTGTGLLTGTVDVRENDNGNITTETWAFTMPFDREGTDWLLYGDQQCAGAAPQSRRRLVMHLLGVNEVRR